LFLGKGALDVGILLDSSEDISSQDWNRITAFTKYFVGTFPKVSSALDGTRFGLITYSRDPAVHFNFRTLDGNRLTRENVQRLIDSTPRRPGTKRRIDSALELAEKDLFSNKGGARQGAKRVNTFGKVMLIFLNYLFLDFVFVFLVYDVVDDRPSGHR
jgi:hypothetical protein